ncbi:MAG: adenylate kinase [Chloroflexota bacterium]
MVLLGPPGAGKGTQARRLERSLSLPHIASGDMFRDIRRGHTPLAREIRSYMDRGEYVPDALTIELMLARVVAPDARDGFVLDGFPRTRGQARALDVALSDEGLRLDRAIYITAPNEMLLERLAGRVICLQCHEIYNLNSKPPMQDMMCDVCGRALKRRRDETPDIAAHRLQTFLDQTKPVVAYYEDQGNLAAIDGSRSMDDVEQEIDQAIGLEGVL